MERDWFWKDAPRNGRTSFLVSAVSSPKEGMLYKSKQTLQNNKNLDKHSLLTRERGCSAAGVQVSKHLGPEMAKRLRAGKKHQYETGFDTQGPWNAVRFASALGSSHFGRFSPWGWTGPVRKRGREREIYFLSQQNSICFAFALKR